MKFVWDGTTWYGTGINAPANYGKVLEQGGQILRTITGIAYSNRVWSKWTLSFSWEQAPTDVKTKLLAMRNYTGNVSFEDSIIGTYTLKLTDDALSVEDTDFGVCTASASFKEV